MRRALLLSVCLFACTAGAALASDQVGKGVVQRSWAAQTSSGPAMAAFDLTSTHRVYANFVWRTAPKPGQVLRIEWQDPSGQVRALWTSRTLRADRKGSRIFAWMGGQVLQGAPGTWRAVLTVGGVARGVRTFTAVGPAAPADPSS